VLTYILIILCLSLAGVAGLQMMYMVYLDRLDKERKKRLHEVEIRCKELSHRLADAEKRIEEQDRMLESLYIETDDGEQWADVIDDR
jgi:16S rRNA C1402 (ribose-2'-O) methylase RsmI